jgi:hypothetical protein
MKRTTSMLMAFLLLVTTVAFAGEAKPTATTEDFLEWGNRLQGRWVGKITLIADWPGYDKKKGEVVQGLVTYRWCVGKKAIEESALEGQAECRRLHFWDAGTKQIKIVNIDSGGTSWTACIGRDGDKWPWTVEGHLPDGSKMEGTGVDTLKADGEFIVDGTVLVGGVKQPPLHDVYQKATTAAEVTQTALPDNAVKELKFFVGDWTVEGDVLGMALKGSWSARWAPQKHCQLISYALTLNGEKVFGNGVMGWDAAKKELVVQMFYSNGVMESIRYRLESPGVFKGVFGGSAGGEATGATCEVRTKGSAEWTFKTKGHTVGGQEKGELSARFVRVERSKK